MFVALDDYVTDEVFLLKDHLLFSEEFSQLQNLAAVSSQLELCLREEGGGRKIWKRKGSIQLGNHLQTKLANYICNEMQSIRLHPYIQNNLFVPSGGDVTEGSSLQSARDLSQGSDMMICKGREGNP